MSWRLWFVLAATVVGARGSRVPLTLGFATPSNPDVAGRPAHFHPAVGGAPSDINHLFEPRHAGGRCTIAQDARLGRKPDTKSALAISVIPRSGRGTPKHGATSPVPRRSPAQFLSASL